jgi:hypothetical protein
MRKLGAVVILLPLVLTSLACPTRPIQSGTGGQGGGAGQSGTGGVGQGGVAGASLGGASGAPAGGAGAGSGGAAGGGLGGGGAGGAAGAPASGGASGVGGALGSGGAADSAGTSGSGGQAGATSGSGGAAGGGGAPVTCGTNQTTCPGGCANLSNDGSNCGTCGHSCLGGTCTNGTCLPVTLAHLTTTVSPAGLAVNSSTVFTTVPGTPWSLYGVPKTAVNTSPSPILTAAAGNNITSFLAASDTVLFVAMGYNSPGGSPRTILSCNPTSCAGTEQTWYTSQGGLLNTCDLSTQECFLFEPGTGSADVQYAKQGTASQSSPQDFSPVLNTALGFPGAANGYIYAGGLYGSPSSTSTYSVLQRVSEDGTGSVSTLANLGLSSQFAINSTPVVTGTRVYVAGSDINGNTTGLISLSLPNGVGNSAPAYLPGTTISSNSWLAMWGDDTAIYFANAAAQWVTCPASGCTGTPTVMADASAAIGYLTGDAQAIYWLNTTFSATDGTATGFSLMRLAR